MVINIDETNCTYFENSILQDIATYKNLPNWLTAIKNEKVNFFLQTAQLKSTTSGFKLYVLASYLPILIRLLTK